MLQYPYVITSDKGKLIMAAQNGSVYWIGNDGQLYLKSAANGWNVTAENPSAANEAQISQFATKIANPTATTPAPGPTNNNPPLNQGAVNNTNLAIQQIAPLLASALSSEDTNYGNTTNALNAGEAAQEKTYGDSTTTNQKNYDSNFMQSILAGVKGLASLKSLLRGSGASGGTAEDQVQDVVGGQTANDIQTGADTQKGNQATLDTALSSFLTDLKSKKAEADDTHANNVHAINRDSATQLQTLYGQLAGYYGDSGDTATAGKYMSEAGAETPSIAANSSTQVTPYDTTPVAVQAPQLTTFAAPSQPNAISAPANGQIGSGIFTLGKKKASDTPATTPVAALQGA